MTLSAKLQKKILMGLADIYPDKNFIVDLDNYYKRITIETLIENIEYLQERGFISECIDRKGKGNYVLLRCGITQKGLTKLATDNSMTYSLNVY